MSACHLYDTWFKRIRELLPTERVTRVRNVAWMIVGLFQGQSVHLSCIAQKLPFKAKLTSITDRFRRLINNPAFAMRTWCKPIAETLLADCLGLDPHGARTEEDGAAVGLVRFIHSLMPDSAEIVLAGDSEFGLIPVARQLDRWHWGYVLRKKQYSCVHLAHKPGLAALQQFGHRS